MRKRRIGRYRFVDKHVDKEGLFRAQVIIPCSERELSAFLVCRFCPRDGYDGGCSVIPSRNTVRICAMRNVEFWVEFFVGWDSELSETSAAPEGSLLYPCRTKGPDKVRTRFGQDGRGPDEVNTTKRAGTPTNLASERSKEDRDQLRRQKTLIFNYGCIQDKLRIYTKYGGHNKCRKKLTKK
jgi:hypothetical protein